MDENAERKNFYRPQNSAGTVSIPRGSKGPRSIYLKRCNDSFGFTLRHFIVYPPDSVAEQYNGRYAAIGALLSPMDTIFVKNVKDHSSAKKAGLQQGDRLIAVNGIPVNDKSYSQVVHLIVKSPDYLHLLVVPKEEDLLQRFFSETAYNPASNQSSCDGFASNIKADHISPNQILTSKTSGFRVDAVSWRSLQQPFSHKEFDSFANAVERNQRSSDNFLYSEQLQSQNQIYAEILPNDVTNRKTSRAVPQTLLYEKMCRRASEGSALSEYDPSDYCNCIFDNCEEIKKDATCSNYSPHSYETDGLSSPKSTRIRLNLEGDQKISTSSLSSSVAGGSKQSLISYDSVSTLTGHEIDDSPIMTRFKNSVKQKEEFLKLPINSSEQTSVRKEFYSRPKKFEKQIWPPIETQFSAGTTSPIHLFSKDKNNVEEEKESVTPKPNGKRTDDIPRQILQNIGKEKKALGEQTSLELLAQQNVKLFQKNIYEDDSGSEKNNCLNGAILRELSCGEKRYFPGSHVVQKRAQDFESGRPLPEDDPVPLNRMNFSRSELARLSSKKLVPNVYERAHEFETRVEENIGTSVSKPYQRCTTALNNSGTHASRIHTQKMVNPHVKKLSGNITIASGSKYLHCCPPAEWLIDAEKPVVVKRRSKNGNFIDDDRAVRRDSYLKATEGGMVNFEHDSSDDENIFSGLLSRGSNSTASLEEEKFYVPYNLSEKAFPVLREGALFCKILAIDGKRYADRSWKQIFMILRGSKLYLFKDKHHQTVTGNLDPLDPSLVAGIDMRTSVVRVAEDYTKKKNVMRISAVIPCRSEFLLQTDTTDDFGVWIKTLKEQVADSTATELALINSNQQAVPQLIPASTTIQVQGNIAETSRNRSPTGQSPVSKSRKPSQVSQVRSLSPKSKTWRGRMVRQFRKLNQGTNSPSSPLAIEGSTFGIPIEDCLSSSSNTFVSRFVEICTNIIEERGLQTVGIYRVPGNNASITALTEEINKNFDDISTDDPKWNDVHVVSSLLKSFFRKMPDSLITVQLYPYFIKADKIENPKIRMEELKKLVRSLPKHNYHTLKHIIYHLNRVANNSEINKMEAKNLAIVFGPTIVRTEGDNMESIVTDMTSQCKIVETLLLHVDWFFAENDNANSLPTPVSLPVESEEMESIPNQALLLHNIRKYEALKETKDRNGALFSSIISAAQRKVKRKSSKSSNSLCVTKDGQVSPTNLKVFPSQLFSSQDLNESSSNEYKSPEPMSATADHVDGKNKVVEKESWFNYSTDKDAFYKRIQNFKLETEAMLQLPRKKEIRLNNLDSTTKSQFSSSTGNVNENSIFSRMKPKDETHDLLIKTRSTTNVTAHLRNPDNARNSVTSMDSASFSLQQIRETADNKNILANSINQENSVPLMRKDNKFSTDNVQRGHSQKNFHTKGQFKWNLKKIRYEANNECQRSGSLDSLEKLPIDDDSLLSTMTKLIDEKLKEEHSSLLTIKSEDISFVDEPPECNFSIPQSSFTDKKNILPIELYRNPSLHKNQHNILKVINKEDELQTNYKEKEEDTLAVENICDNERSVFNTTRSNFIKLKRSESLNKPERTVVKVKRSESMNKADYKLKRIDSLSKSEKTESNNNKRRELSLSNKRLKDFPKNKRKNGIPDRSLNRRHTVGGTKDLVNMKESSLRTSSPDLTTTRRDNFVFEINLICPENMVLAFKKHLIGTKPNFLKTEVYKMSLESHV